MLWQAGRSKRVMLAALAHAELIPEIWALLPPVLRQDDDVGLAAAIHGTLFPEALRQCVRD